MAHAGRTWEAHVPQQVSLEGAGDLARHSSQQPSAGVTPRRVPEISILWKRNSAEMIHRKTLHSLWVYVSQNNDIVSYKVKQGPIA